MEQLPTFIRSNNMRHQQGDVTLEPAAIPATARKLKTKIVAEGGATGHAHKIVEGEGTATIYEEKGNLYLQVENGQVELVHEEHNTQTILPGEYEIGRVLEYDYDTEEARRVAD
jgi:hypothetical protein